jgi:hypothetical protein
VAVRTIGTVLKPRFLRDLDVLAVQPEVCEWTLADTGRMQIDMFLQAQSRPELKGGITVRKAREIVNSVLKQADELTSIKMLESVHALLYIQIHRLH